MICIDTWCGFTWTWLSWCTVWKGTPHDCMDHIRGAHDVPWSAILEKYLPPWTVTRKVWSDSLTAQHSGISTDVLLFSDIHLSLVHHYRIHKRGLPHIAFRRNYMSQLCALLPLSAVPPAVGVVSPDSSSSDSLYPAGSPEVMDRSPRTTRRAFRRRRPVRVMEPPVENIPVLMIQDPLAAAGVVVLDCRPPLLPVSMDISGVDLSAIRGPAVLADVDVLPLEREPLFGGGGGGLAGINLSPVLRSTPDDSPPSGLAAMDQDSPWTTSLEVGESTGSPLLPAPLTPRRMIAGQFASGSGVSSGETDVTGGHPRMLDLSREGPFDVLQDRPDSGVSPRVLDGVRGCQYRITPYDEESGS